MCNYSNAFICGLKNLRASSFKDHAASDMHAQAMLLLKKQSSSDVPEYTPIMHMEHQRSHIFANCFVVLQPSKCGRSFIVLGNPLFVETPRFLGGGSSQNKQHAFFLGQTFCLHMLGIDWSRGIITRKLSDNRMLS